MKLVGVYETTLPATMVASTLFNRHLVDLNRADIESYLESILDKSGLATFGGISDRSVFADLARELTVLHPHPDADTDGLTLLSAQHTGPAS